MPIRVDYSPVGAALSLARTAGEGQNWSQKQARDIELLKFGMARRSSEMEAAARDRAFALQEAYASRTLTSSARARTPVADHAAERLKSKQNRQDEEQQVQLQQLQQMRDAGTIDEKDFETYKLRILGNQSPKEVEPKAPKAPPVSVRRAEYEDQRRMLMEDYKALKQWEGTTNLDQSPYKDKAGIEAEKRRIAAGFAGIASQEREAFGIAIPGEKSGRAKLTPEIAKALLEEADFDKNKARALARERGYDF